MDDIKVTYSKKKDIWFVTMEIGGAECEMTLGESMILTGKLIEALNHINNMENKSIESDT